MNPQELRSETNIEMLQRLEQLIKRPDLHLEFKLAKNEIREPTYCWRYECRHEAPFIARLFWVSGPDKVVTPALVEEYILTCRDHTAQVIKLASDLGMKFGVNSSVNGACLNRPIGI